MEMVSIVPVAWSADGCIELHHSLLSLAFTVRAERGSPIERSHGFWHQSWRLADDALRPAGNRRDIAPVVVLHGSTQTADAYAEGAGWLALADRFGFALVCPEQTRDNNAYLAFNWYQPSDIAREGGEAASIGQMVQGALAHYDIDAERVFVTGLSAGGAMTAVMLTTYPELFAAGAVIAGLPYGAASNKLEACGIMYRGHRLDHEWGDKVRAAFANPSRRPRGLRKDGRLPP